MGRWNFSDASTSRSRSAAFASSSVKSSQRCDPIRPCGRRRSPRAKIVLGDRRLVAYVVGDESGTAGGLREHLRLRLPDYMVPAVFVPLENLPLTPNGKLDRRALPAPAATELDSDYVAPRNPLEQVIADLWRELLGAERVGAHDNFFAGGGHSLLAAQALTRIRKIFQVELSLRTFFEAATPEKVAQALLAADSRPGRVSLIAAQLLRIRAMSAEERARLGERRQQTTAGPWPRDASRRSL